MASAATRDGRVLIGYRYDDTGERAFLRGSDRVQAALGDLGSSTRINGNILERAFTEADDNLDELRQSVQQLETALNDAGDAASTVSAGVERASSARGGGGVTEGIDRFGRFGSQIASGLGGGELANAAGLFGDLSDALGTLGPVGVAATGAIAGLTIGIGLLNTQLEPILGAFRAALSAQDQYYAALGQLNEEQVRERIDELKAQNVLIAQQLAEGRAALEANITPLGLTLTDIAAGLQVQAAQALNEFRAKLDELQATFDSNAQAVVRLQQGLDSGVFATQSSTTAVEEATRAYREQERAGYAAATAVKNVIETTRTFADAGLTPLERAGQMSQRRAELQLQTEQKYYAALRAIGPARDRFAESTQAYAEAQVAGQQRIAQATREANADVQKLTTSYNKERVRSEEDLRDRLAQITRNANAQLRDAVANRDALGFVQARRARDQQLSEEQANASKAAIRRRQDFQQQLAEQQAAGARRIAQERAAAQREIATRQQALLASQQLLLQAVNAERALRDAGARAIIKDAQQQVATLQSIWARVVQPPTKPGLPTPGPKGAQAINVYVNAGSASSVQAAVNRALYGVFGGR